MLIRLASIIALALFSNACSNGQQPTAPLTGLTYRAESHVLPTSPATIQATVTVTNTNNQAVMLEPAGGCVLLLQAYQNPSRSGPPAWDQAAVVACTGFYQQVTLLPGASRDFQVLVKTTDILKSARLAGHYYFSAVLRLNGREMVLPAGKADLTP